MSLLMSTNSIVDSCQVLTTNYPDGCIYCLDKQEDFPNTERWSKRAWQLIWRDFHYLKKERTKIYRNDPKAIATMLMMGDRQEKDV